MAGLREGDQVSSLQKKSMLSLNKAPQALLIKGLHCSHSEGSGFMPEEYYQLAVCLLHYSLYTSNTMCEEGPEYHKAAIRAPPMVQLPIAS